MNSVRTIAAQAIRPSLSVPGTAACTVASRSLRTHVLSTRMPTTTTTTTTMADGPATTASETAAYEGAKMQRIESMPFQTYQFALNVIRKDREEKLEAIRLHREKLSKMIRNPRPSVNALRIKGMYHHLEYMAIQADINSPRVKYNFDRGIIGMSKPVYRHLMDKKWRKYERPILMQRLTQMHVVPDVLPNIDPIVDIQLRFKRKDIPPGTIVEAAQSERPPTFKVIPFAPGKMFCTVVVIDLDVPDIKNDRFTYKLHWLVSNIQLSPSQTQATGTNALPADTIVNWLPPHAQKGSPYHRYAMFILKQPDKIDPKTLEGTERHGFNLRRFIAIQNVDPIGAFMWRSQWDKTTKDVMKRNGLEGWDRMLVRTEGRVNGR